MFRGRSILSNFVAQRFAFALVSDDAIYVICYKCLLSDYSPARLGAERGLLDDGIDELPPSEASVAYRMDTALCMPLF